MTDSIDDFGIAVIGISGRFPGAKDINDFWRNLLEGNCARRHYSDEELLNAGVDSGTIKNTKYVKAGYSLSDIDQFDAQFFGFTPREAECIDPQQRLFLECAWATFENAGYNSENYEGLVGVYAGCGKNNYFFKNLNTNPELVKSVGNFELNIDNEKDYLASRVAYKLNLKGPAINVQSACSTSLVAVCLGFQSLMTYQCDMALCGGVSLLVPHNHGYMYQEGMIFSPDGYCRPFDVSSNGTVQGEGVGAVLLKRLDEAIEDGDCIYAVIKGAAVNNDGSVKAGFTAPGIEGQAMAIKMAQRLADVSPDTISYIEGHGTGTPIGDPIEIAALTDAFREKTSKNNFCAIGSVKSNIGHLDAAAGIAGFIKTVLSLYNKKIPPTVHFESPNPKLNLETSPFYINTQAIDWPNIDAPLRAGVSSFGIGGTNAHVILEEAPTVRKSTPSRDWKVFPLSSRNYASLQLMTLNLAGCINSNEVDLNDAAYTLQTGRKIFDYRSVIIGRSRDEIVKSIESNDSKYIHSANTSLLNQNVVFMFTGQGSQYVGMSANLYKDEQKFRDLVDYCSEKLKFSIGLDLRDVLYPKEENLEFAENELAKTAIAQPALFVVEYSLAKLWMSWGIIPQALIGHSIGEYVAACLSGVFTLDDALKIVAERGKLLQSMPPGSMLFVPLSDESVEKYLPDGVCVATVNSDSLCVTAGATSLIKELEAKLNEDNISTRILNTSHAFHSELIAPSSELLVNEVKKLTLSEPSIPYISNLTGEWIETEEATNPQYYGEQLCNQVKFYQGIRTLIGNSYNLFLEVGPGNTLCTFVNRTLKAEKSSFSLAPIQSLPHPLDRTPDSEMLARALGKLWLGGANIDWNIYYNDEERKRMPLPSYQFEKNRHWIDLLPSVKDSNYEEFRNFYNLGKNQQLLSFNQTKSIRINDISLKLREIWSEVLGLGSIDIKDSFFDLGGTSLMATKLISIINERLSLDLTLTDFFIEPTISGLNELILRNINHETSIHPTETNLPILFPIQPKGLNPPLYIVAGAHENRYYDPIRMKSSYEEDFLRYLSNLIPYLGMNQPVYGFRPKGLLLNEKPHRSVKEIAADYIKEIKKYQPEGPYLIAGECIGGLVAYEIAQQLSRDNQEVGHLIMMDTHFPSFKFAMRERFYYMGHKLKRTVKDALAIKKNKGSKAVMSFLKGKADFLLMFFLPITKNLRIKRHIILGGYKYRKTLLAYKPSVYTGEATMLLNEVWHDNEAHFGWNNDYRKSLNIIKVPGNHITRLTTYGEMTGKNIKKIIKDTLENYKK